MPTADPNAVFQRIITRRDIELAVVFFLRTWVPQYIPEIERQGGLRPGQMPLPPDQLESYRGCLDWDTWEQAWAPVYLVQVRPGPAPERYHQGIYLQEFSIEVACNVVVTDEFDSLGKFEEDSARQYADLYGAAALAAILQHGGLGTWPDGTSVSTKTVMAAYPDTVLPLPDVRSLARCTFAVTAVIDDVLNEAAGPTAPVANPYIDPGDWPLAELVNVVTQAEHLSDDNTSPLSGGSVASDSGHVVVHD